MNPIPAFYYRRVLDLFTWEIRHASICASVGRRVLL